MMVHMTARYICHTQKEHIYKAYVLKTRHTHHTLTTKL